jgi:hypothetical protein
MYSLNIGGHGFKLLLLMVWHKLIVYYSKFDGDSFMTRAYLPFCLSMMPLLHSHAARFLPD